MGFSLEMSEVPLVRAGSGETKGKASLCTLRTQVWSRGPEREAASGPRRSEKSKYPQFDRLWGLRPPQAVCHSNSTATQSYDSFALIFCLYPFS